MKNYLYQTIRATAALLIAAAFLSTSVLLPKSSFRAFARENIQKAAPPAPANSKIYFEENRGQFDERARFVSRGTGGTMFLAATEAVYVLPTASEESPESGVRSPKSEIQNPESELIERIQNPKSKIQNRKAFALRMQFVGANPAAEVSGVDEIETKTNYFRGNDPTKWLTDVPNYSRVRYTEVYPDVDLEFYGNAENKSEYDFIVKPEADASQIELDFAGADSVEIDKATGELLINTAAGIIKQSKPYTYQKSAAGAKQEIASGYETIGATRVRFRVGEYDASKPLVIDPALNNLAFSTLIGGAGTDFGSSVQIDAAGNVYIGGDTDSDLFPTTSGTYDTGYNGGSGDFYVSKFSADGGNLIYSTYLGGNAFDGNAFIAIDTAGSVYITGYAGSIDYPTTPGAYDTTNSGGDAVVTKLNATGNGLIYSTFVGGSSTDIGYSIAVDAAGSAYIAGQTSSNNFPTPGGIYTGYSGATDAFAAKLNAGGTALVYSTYLGSSAYDVALGVSINNAGNLIVSGYTSGANFPTTAGAFDTSSNGSEDVFVTKINTAGNALVFSTYIGGAGTDKSFANALDSVGNIYVTGNTTGGTPAFPAMSGAFDVSHNGNEDVFVSKLTPNGALAYSTFIGGSENDDASGITVDASGNAYVTGNTSSANYPVSANTYDSTYNSSPDVFVSKLNSAGSGLSYSTFFGGSSSDFGNAIALDSANNIYVSGSTYGGFPTTANAFQTDWAGNSDVIVAKFGNYAITGRAVDTTGAAVSNAMIAVSGSSSASALTDASGNFVFLDQLPNRPYTVSASKTGTVFNPSLFNIANLNDNRSLIFVAGGAPSGGGSGSNLTFSAPSYAVNEPENTATIRVWRETATINNTVSVNYSTSNGTANAGTDYAATSGVLTFAPGEVEKTFRVAIADDVAIENSETVNLSLSNPTGGATLGTSAAILNINDNGEPQTQMSGSTLDIVASGGVFKDRHLAGIAASPTDGTLYVATDDNFIEPPTNLTNNCGTQPDQSKFDLFKIAPNGTTTLIGTYQIPHRALVNLELKAQDGLLYTAGTDRRIYSINPTGGAVSVFNANVGFDTERYGLETDASGNLIAMSYGAPNSFYRIPAGSGATFLGSYANDSSANFGDRFGIQPDGDYVVYSDAPAARNPREFEIDTTGHADGNPFNFAYLSASNVRTLGSAYIHSNGAVNPANGDVYTAGGNCAAGSSVILYTPASGAARSSVFINGIGNAYSDGAENFNARGVTDLDFGAKRNGQAGNCLYFTDDFNDVVYQSCSVAPTAAAVSLSGRVLTRAGAGVSKATVSMTDANGQTRSTVTNPTGFYRFDEVAAGETYIFTVRAKRYQFDSQAVSVNEQLTELDFTAQK